MYLFDLTSCGCQNGCHKCAQWIISWLNITHQGFPLYFSKGVLLTVAKLPVSFLFCWILPMEYIGIEYHYVYAVDEKFLRPFNTFSKKTVWP